MEEARRKVGRQDERSEKEVCKEGRKEGRKTGRQRKHQTPRKKYIPIITNVIHAAMCVLLASSIEELKFDVRQAFSVMNVDHLFIVASDCLM